MDIKNGINVTLTEQTTISSLAEHHICHLQDETTWNDLFLIADQGNHLCKNKAFTSKRKASYKQKRQQIQNFNTNDVTKMAKSGNDWKSNLH